MSVSFPVLGKRPLIDDAKSQRSTDGLRLSSKGAKQGSGCVSRLPGRQSWRGRAGPGREDMSLEVSRVDHSGREVLELHRGLVAIEEIHSACGSRGERQGSI